jgi:hypothetical protein
MSPESILTLSGVGFPSFSCREAEQTLIPLRSGELRRTVNGELCYTGPTHHHKYLSTVTCQEKNAPGIQQLWVGAEVTLGSLIKVWEEFTLTKRGIHTLALSRPYEIGSVEIANVPLVLTEKDATHIELTHASDKTVKVLVGFRPRLVMRVKDFRFSHKEWAESILWTVILEEI